jgi:hypothetical protein
MAFAIDAEYRTPLGKRVCLAIGADAQAPIGPSGVLEIQLPSSG